MAVDTAARSSTLPSFGWLTSYGELLRTLLRREIRVRYKGSALGIVWALIYPLAMMGVYTLLFSVLWKTAGNIPHYPLFVLTGLAVWGFFQASVQLGSASLISSGELIKKVWFPRELVPAAAVLAQTLVAGIMFAILIPVNLAFVPETARTLALVVPFLAALLCLALGLAWIFSVANVFYRDVEHILGVVLMAWYFLTPILFPISLVANRPRELLGLSLNPMTGIVVGFQRALLDGLPPDWSLLAWSAAFALAIFVIGFTYFRRAKDDFESAL